MLKSQLAKIKRWDFYQNLKIILSFTQNGFVLSNEKKKKLTANPWSPSIVNSNELGLEQDGGK